MRVHEIVTERREKVDEALPLLALPVLGSLSFGAIMSMVFAAWSVVDIIGFIEKANKDPENMTKADWVWLFVNLITLLPILKVAPKFVKDKIVKMIPDSWKDKGAEKVKEIVTKASSKSPGKSSSKMGTAAAVAGGAAAGAGGTAAVNKLSAPTSSQSSASSTQPSTLGGTTFGADTDKGDKFSRWFGRTQ